MSGCGSNDKVGKLTEGGFPIETPDCKRFIPEGPIGVFNKWCVDPCVLEVTYADQLKKQQPLCGVASSKSYAKLNIDAGYSGFELNVVNNCQ